MPSRYRQPLDAPLEVTQLPDGVEWKGKVAFIDRDGVLNSESEGYVLEPSDLILFKGAGNCIAQLRHLGYRTVLVTNQSPVGRGLISVQTLDEIHDRLIEMLLDQDSEAILDLILYAPQPPWAGAWARKPSPGMLNTGNVLLNDLRDELGKGPEMEPHHHPESVMFGDRSADQGAARNAGVRFILVSAGGLPVAFSAL